MNDYAGSRGTIPNIGLIYSHKSAMGNRVLPLSPTISKAIHSCVTSDFRVFDHDECLGFWRGALMDINSESLGGA
ncbi:hypothetical protein SAMN05216316_0486 [Nitrosovibrio sp. Nv6]|nr:hypothetical protein SAMN05216316_0486 [Nitrosovibrio sp. Nv6]